MSDSYVDNLPSHQREQLRKRMRSPEEYERLREKVKGPEDLEREMESNAEFAEAKLTLENDPSRQEQAKEAVAVFARENGVASSVEHPSIGLNDALDQGSFEIGVQAPKGVPVLTVTVKNSPSGNTSDAPSGNVAEVFPLKPALQQQILTSLKLQR